MMWEWVGIITGLGYALGWIVSPLRDPMLGQEIRPSGRLKAVK